MAAGRHRALTLFEVLVAVTIFGITLLGFIMGLAYIHKQNKSLSQRELAIGQAREIVELMKLKDYPEVRNSENSSPIYLKQLTNGNWDTDWKVPAAGGWEELEIESLNSSSGSNPGTLTDKLPDAEWSAEITEVLKGTGQPWNFKRVAVTVRWKTQPGGDKWQTFTLNTVISPVYTRL